MRLVVKFLLIGILFGDELTLGGATYGESSKSTSIFVPVHYKLSLVVSNKTLTTDSIDFSGHVQIKFEVEEETSHIILHAHKAFIQINEVSLNSTIVEDYSMDAVAETLRIQAKVQLHPNRTHTLKITYDAIMSTKDMLGMYKIKYVDGKGTIRFAVFTNFDGSSARRVFPCFDEPQHRAPFDVVVTVPYRKYAQDNVNVIFSTSDIDREPINETQLITFETTPKLPTYLLSLSISDLYSRNEKRLPLHIDYNLFLRNELISGCHLAENVTSLAWTYFDNFTSFNLHTQRLNKLDQIGIPDARAVTTAKWGLLTFSESDIYWNDGESSSANKQTTVFTIVKSIAQQWFGNLDAINWRSDLVLDTGLVIFFAYDAAHEIHPEFQLDRQFAVETLSRALKIDSTSNTHSLTAGCRKPASGILPLCQVKGASLLRMVEDFMSKRIFKAAIRKYMHKNISDPEDIWNCLYEADDDKSSHLPVHLSKAMDNWVTQPGYPLLVVKMQGRTVTVSQETFWDSGESTHIGWYVPVKFAYGGARETTKTSMWLTPTDRQVDLITLANDADWVILNDEATGYYRVNYDDKLWDNIVLALHREKFDGISEINRAKLVDDSFHLAGNGKIKFSRLFENVSFLKKDTSYYCWYAALQGFDLLLKRFGEFSDLGNYIKADLVGLMDLLNKTVTVVEDDKDDHISTQRQNLVLAWASRLNIAHYVEAMSQTFQRLKHINKRPHRNLRNVIYCNALRYEGSRDDWHNLLTSYRQVSDLPDEQLTIISALGCTNDSEILRSYLQMTAERDSLIEQQHAALAFKSVYTNSPQGVQLCLQFLTTNFSDILSRYQYLDDIRNIMEGLADRITTDEELQTFKTLLNHADFPEDLVRSIEAIITSTGDNLKWSAKYGGDLEFYYDIRGLEATAQTYSVFIFLALGCLGIFAATYCIYKKRAANRVRPATGDFERFQLEEFS